MRTIAILSWLVTLNHLAQAEDMLFPVQEEGRWGFINTSGSPVIPLTFYSANPFSDGLALVAVEDDAGRPVQGFIDSNGSFVIGPGPPKNCELVKREWSFQDFSEGYAGYWVGDSTERGGYIDKSGHVAIPVGFQGISDFSEGLACVDVPDNQRDIDAPPRTGFIDKKGKFVIKPIRSLVAQGFVNGLCVFSIANERFEWKSGVIDRSSTTVVPPIYDGASHFSNGLCRVSRKRNGRRAFGFIDSVGTVEIAIDFDSASNFVDGIAYVAKGNARKLINTSGEVVAEVIVSPKVKRVSDFSEGLAAITVEDGTTGRYGFIDVNGVVAIPIEYDYADSFYGGLALVSKGPETGYINHDGEFVWKTTKWNLWYSAPAE